MDTSISIGKIKLHNGSVMVFGTSIISTWSADSVTGGYSKIVNLSSYGLTAPIFAMISPRYTAGFPRACIHYIDDTNMTIKLGCDVNVTNAYVEWFVIG